MKEKTKEEVDIKDIRIKVLEKQLVKGSIVTRVFKLGSKYEVHYFDPKNGLCRSFFAARD